EDLRRLLDLVLAGVAGGARSQRRLDDSPDVEELRDHLALAGEDAGERHHQRVGGEIAHHRAVALPRFEDAHHLQRPHRVPDRAPPYAGADGQVPLRREASGGSGRGTPARGSVSSGGGSERSAGSSNGASGERGGGASAAYHASSTGSGARTRGRGGIQKSK